MSVLTLQRQAEATLCALSMTAGDTVRGDTQGNEMLSLLAQ